MELLTDDSGRRGAAKFSMPLWVMKNLECKLTIINELFLKVVLPDRSGKLNECFTFSTFKKSAPCKYNFSSSIGRNRKNEQQEAIISVQ